jgi:glycosyltransferase involved in cell wall biosynthesis
LPVTLEHLSRASDRLGVCRDEEVEVIVVDNASTDRTAEIALASGARVVPVPEHNIGRVRNAGASAAAGDLLVFLDADTVVPSCRRYDQWSTWRILVETSPFHAMLFQRRRAAWRGWYSDVPR